MICFIHVKIVLFLISHKTIREHFNIFQSVNAIISTIPHTDVIQTKTLVMNSITLVKTSSLVHVLLLTAKCPWVGEIFKYFIHNSIHYTRNRAPPPQHKILATIFRNFRPTSNKEQKQIAKYQSGDILRSN